MYVCLNNWITLLCSWNTVSQLHFSEMCALRKQSLCTWRQRNLEGLSKYKVTEVKSPEVNLTEVKLLDEINLGI